MFALLKQEKSTSGYQAAKNTRRAGRTGLGPGLDDVVGVGMQLPPRAVSAATFAISSALTANAAANCVRSAMTSASLSRVVKKLMQLLDSSI